MMRIISPSMLSADFGNLERDTLMIDRSVAQWIHIDVMDGVFVPNISFGFPMVSAVRKLTQKCLDVHLMIVEPERYVKRFAESGADMITFHYEATQDSLSVINMIHSLGVKAGISIKPSTPVSAIEPLWGSVDLVLVMSVEPGFGGQKFQEGAIDKTKELREIIDREGYEALIEVDGGISAANAHRVYDAGADAVVAGNAIFSVDDPMQEIENILNS